MSKVVSPFILRGIYRAARSAAMRSTKGTGLHSDPSTEAQVLGNQAAYRRIHKEFHRHLRKAGIHVEGVTR